MRDMTLRDWIATAIAIDRRRPSAARYRAADRHLAAFPFEDLRDSLDADALCTLREMIVHGVSATLFRQPPRGHRGSAPQTRMLMDANNRIRFLETRGMGHNSEGVR